MEDAWTVYRVEGTDTEDYVESGTRVTDTERVHCVYLMKVFYLRR